MYQKVNRDLFRIEDRLRRINKNYRIFRNNKSERFEVREGAGGNGPLCFVIPYDKLDCRTLEFALKTRRQNEAQLEQEVDSHNREIEESTNRALKHQRQSLQDMLSYAARTGHTVDFTKNYLKEF